MASEYVTTKFIEVVKVKTSNGYYIVRKTVDDDVIQIITYGYVSPLKDCSSLRSIEYMSPSRAEKLGYL